MADSIEFLPLYVIFHDQWAFRTWHYTWPSWWYQPYPHYGHCHFFMLGHRPHSFRAQQAYTGSQPYRFSFGELWSQRSEDPNQAQNIRYIGSPKWYFYVREYWRRVYIQPWDDPDNSNVASAIVGKKGIKWDASIYNYGPFRENRNMYFYWNNMPRTLPIEYFQDDLKHVRDHYLREGKPYWNLLPAEFDGSMGWVIPRNYWAGGDNGHDGPTEDNNARQFGYADKFYAYPTIEYQVVEHLKWERLPGWEGRTEGDGFELAVNLPFTISGVVQSPFSDDNGNVSPPGGYHHGFATRHPERVLRYPVSDVPSHPPAPPSSSVAGDWTIPAELKGQPVQWSVPEHYADKMDGMWVEQCLGGIVQAKALVTVADNFGGTREVWVTDSQFMVTDDFAGTDQNVPAD